MLADSMICKDCRICLEFKPTLFFGSQISKTACHCQCNFPDLLLHEIICNNMWDVITKPYFNFQQKNSEKSRFFG